MIVPTAFSLPGMARDEKITRSPGDRAMSGCSLLRDAGERGARLALRAGEQRDDLVARADSRRCRAAGNPAGRRDSRIRARRRRRGPWRGRRRRPRARIAGAASATDAHARDVRGEGGDRDAVRRLPDELGEVAGDVRSRSGSSPSRTTFVESQTSASTPSSPSARKAASDVRLPRYGVSSSFQSPVWTTSPSGVRMASAFDSGIECATGTNSMSNGPELEALAAGRPACRSTFGAPGSDKRRVSRRPTREARRVDRRPQARPHLDERADMVLMRMGDEDAEQVLPLLLDEAQVRDRRDRCRADAPRRRNPCRNRRGSIAVVRRPEAVERGIHADLAETAEGNEDELVWGSHLSGPCSAGARLGRHACRSGK